MNVCGFVKQFHCGLDRPYPFTQEISSKYQRKLDSGSKVKHTQNIIYIVYLSSNQSLIDINWTAQLKNIIFEKCKKNGGLF